MLPRPSFARTGLVPALLAVAAALAPAALAQGKEVPDPVVETRRWFANAAQEAEAAVGESEVVGVFAFANPNDRAIDWRALESSCACTRALIAIGDRRYEWTPKPAKIEQLFQRGEGKPLRVEVRSVPVGPHEHGELRLVVDVLGSGSHKSVKFDVHTTDDATPMARVSFEARSKVLFTVAPASVDLGVLQPGATADFTVALASAVRPDFEVKDVELPPGVTAKWSKATTEQGPVWRIVGRYAGDETRTGGPMKVETDIPGATTISVMVRARIQPPVEVTPGFAQFGLVRQGQKASRSFRLVPHDGTKIAVRNIRFANLTVAEGVVTATHHLDGDAIVVDLEVGATAPPGIVRGDCILEIDHPTRTTHTVKFAGYVR